MPSSCSEEEVREALKLLGDELDLKLNPARCISKEKAPELDAADIGFMLGVKHLLSEFYFSSTDL